MDEKVYTIKGAAQKINYSERHLRQLCIDDKVPGAYKIADGRKWLIPEHAIEALKKNQGSESVAKVQQDVPIAATMNQEPYEEAPLKKEDFLLVHGLSPGDRDVEFLVTNVSNHLLIVNKICVEIMYWEEYRAPLTTGARIIDYKYRVKIKPNFIGEILVRTPKFKYAKGDVDIFSISFVSPPGNKYITRINLYCSAPETGERYTVSTDTFEIHFHKFVGGGGISSGNAIAQAQKLIDEAKKTE